jgi:hypothetical protein
MNVQIDPSVLREAKSRAYAEGVKLYQLVEIALLCLLKEKKGFISASTKSIKSLN